MSGIGLTHRNEVEHEEKPSKVRQGYDSEMEESEDESDSDGDDGDSHEGGGSSGGSHGSRGSHGLKTIKTTTIDELTEQLSQINFDRNVYKTPPIFNKSHEGVSSQELIVAFNRAHDRWFGKDAMNIDPVARPYYVFGLRINQAYSEEVITKVYAKLHLEVVNLQIAFEKTGVMEQKQAMIADYQRKFNELHGLLYNSRHALTFISRINDSLDMKKCNTSPEKFDLYRFSAFDSDDLDSFGQLIKYIQFRVADDELVAKGEIFCKETISHYKGEWHTNHRYEWISIRQYILKQCNPRTNAAMFKNMNDKSNLDRAVKYFSECGDDVIPKLERDRSISAWKNGLWFAEYGAFYPYSEGRLPNNVCATVYIDQVFDTKDYGANFMDMPCIITKILSDQGFSREEQSFILGVALGRLIFEPGKFDRWEIIPFLWGMAQTGKSCIIDACCKLFDPRDVQGVGNNIEKQFGLASLVGKLLWVANDVKKNFGMDAGDLQTITSLELMSVAVKYKDAVSLKWDVSGIIAGNEFPKSWTDTLQALERRILLIDFPNSILRDNGVKTRLENERSIFYRMITAAYHYWQRKCGDKNIWDYAPRRFRDARKIIREHENPIQMFLNSSQVKITKDPADYVREENFRWAFKNFQTTIGGGYHQRIAPTEMAQILKNEGVLSKPLTRPWPLDQKVPGSEGGPPLVDPITGIVNTIRTVTGNFYLGIKLVKNTVKGGTGPGSGGGPGAASFGAAGGMAYRNAGINPQSVGGNYSNYAKAGTTTMGIVPR